MYDMVIACVFVWFFVGMLFWVLCSLRNEMLGAGGIWLFEYETRRSMHTFTLLFCMILPPVAMLIELLICITWDKTNERKNDRNVNC